MNNLNDEELKKAAMGDLDDAKKKPKTLWVIAIILVVLILVGVFSNGNSDKNSDNYIPVEDEEYYDTSEYDDGSIDDTSYDTFVQIDQFKVIDNVYVDVTDNSYYIKYNTDYNETIDGYKLSYSGYDDPTDGSLNIGGPNGESLQVMYECDLSQYTSTGMVTVKINGCSDDSDSGIMSFFNDIGLTVENTTYETEPMVCDFASSISSDFFDKFKEKADVIMSSYSDAQYISAYFGYTDDRTGNSTYDTKDFNNLMYIYTYTDNGHPMAGYVSFTNIKSGEDGFVCNFVDYSDDNNWTAYLLYETTDEILEDINESSLSFSQID